MMKWNIFAIAALFSVSGAYAHDIIPQEEDTALFEEGAREQMFRATTKASLEDHASRRIQVMINKSRKAKGVQTMDVLVDGQPVYEFVISTAWERMKNSPSGRTFFATTPEGKFLPDGMQSKRYSNTFQVWLNYVIRFTGGVWLHATTPDHYAELGQPASAGCVRMHLDDAEKLYKLVSSYGMNQLAITVLAAPGEKQVPARK